VRRAHTIQAPHHMTDPTAIVCAAGPQISERGLGRNARQVSKKAGRAADVDPVLTGRQIGIGVGAVRGHIGSRVHPRRTIGRERLQLNGGAVGRGARDERIRAAFERERAGRRRDVAERNAFGWGDRHGITLSRPNQGS
jgi:hypothetical protein